MASGFAYNGDHKIAYETLGYPENPTIVFISGLGSQLVHWTDEFCQHYLDRGYHIIRFDNRDVGLSGKTDGPVPPIAEILQMDTIEKPYSVSDMAADVIALLDELGIDAAHIVGTSMGGMVAQTVAIEHPDRVKTLTSIMSGPKRPDTINSDDEERDAAVAASVTVEVHNPDTYVDLQVEGWRLTSGPHFDADYMRGIVQRSFERCYHPDGWAFQMLALSGDDRTERLGRLRIPALVIHGALDPLVPLKYGEATAAAIPGAKLLVLDEMGHNLPRLYWDQIAEAITSQAKAFDEA